VVNLKENKMTDFIRANNPSVEISGSTTSARAAIPNTNGTNVRLSWSGTDYAYVRTGDNTVTATTGTAFVAPNSIVEMFSTMPNDTHIAVVAKSGTGILYVQSTTGE